jgi:hypothetical protein
MPEPLKPHQQRVLQEGCDLHENIVKLDVFLISGFQVDGPERRLLVAQLASMQTYYAILQMRIARWQDHPDLQQIDLSMSVAELNDTPRLDFAALAEQTDRLISVTGRFVPAGGPPTNRQE